MPDTVLSVLLDQNVPQECTGWLQDRRPGWTVRHVNTIGLMGRSDARTFPLGAHHGVIRLRVWPTTVEATIAGLQRVLDQVPASDIPRNLIIVDNQRIRLRRAPAQA